MRLLGSGEQHAVDRSTYPRRCLPIGLLHVTSMSKLPYQQVRKVMVSADLAGQRIDNFLMRELKDLPRSAIYRILRRGEVRVNGGRTRQTYKLQAGDEVRIPPVRVRAQSPAPKVSAGLGQTLERSILYEDRDLLVINKPSGLAVHGGSGQSLGLIEALRVMRPDQTGLELVHRLDKPTSGCLLIAKRRSRLRQLHEALRLGQMRKNYLALAEGRWPAQLKQVDVPLRKSVLRSGERLVKVREDGKAALSRFKRVAECAQATLLNVNIKTGRTHQIRVHAAHSGHPIAGDDKYGNDAFNTAMMAVGLRRLFLHASHVEVGDLQVTAPLPNDLANCLRALNIDPDYVMPPG